MAAAAPPAAAAPKLSLVQRATAAANVQQQQQQERTNDNNNRSISFGSVRPFWPLWGSPSGSVGRTLAITNATDARQQDTLCFWEYV